MHSGFVRCSSSGGQADFQLMCRFPVDGGDSHERLPRTTQKCGLPKTCKKMREHVNDRHGFTPESCCVGPVMEDSGIPRRQALKHSPQARRVPCPPVKLNAARAAIRGIEVPQSGHVEGRRLGNSRRCLGDFWRGSGCAKRWHLGRKTQSSIASLMLSGAFPR